VIGDALSATTHLDLMIRAKELGIETQIIHNATVFNAVAATGLQIYKFGKTTSIPFPQENFKVETPYDVIKQNKSIDAHTLVLLDLRPSEGKFMTAAEAVKILLDIEKRRKEKIFTKDTMCIACSMLGSSDQTIRYKKAKELLRENIPGIPQCLVVPGKLHFIEEDFVQAL
jgi:diphthine synthase